MHQLHWGMCTGVQTMSTLSAFSSFLICYKINHHLFLLLVTCQYRHRLDYLRLRLLVNAKMTLSIQAHFVELRLGHPDVLPDLLFLPLHPRQHGFRAQPAVRGDIWPCPRGRRISAAWAYLLASALKTLRKPSSSLSSACIVFGLVLIILWVLLGRHEEHAALLHESSVPLACGLAGDDAGAAFGRIRLAASPVLPADVPAVGQPGVVLIPGLVIEDEFVLSIGSRQRCTSRWSSRTLPAGTSTSACSRTLLSAEGGGVT